MIIKIPKKEFYSISEIASAFNVNASLLRYWESEFDILNPKKDKRGNRQYNSVDIDNIRIIYSLLKEKGFTIDGAKEYLKNNIQKINNKINVVNKLKAIKEQLLNIKSNL